MLLAATSQAMADTALHAHLDSARAAHGVAAFAYVLADARGVLDSGFGGIADLASGAAVTSTSRFRIGSITKTFTALALLLGEQDGLLSIDDRLDQHIGPDLVDNPWADTRPVRLVHLLEHTAGLRELTAEEFHNTDPAPRPLSQVLRKSATHRRIEWQPGRYYVYTNAGAGLAAHALERRSGVSYEDFLRERLFAPLGMTHASVLLDEATRKNLVTGYDADHVTPIPYWHMIHRPFGAINVRPVEMAGLLGLLLGRGDTAHGRLLPAAAIERMERATTTPAALSGLAFGYGLGIRAWSNDGVVFFGHGGDGDGYLAHFGYSPAAGRGYFVVINAFDHAALDALREILEHAVIADAPRRRAPPVQPIEDRLGALGGYRRAATRFGEPSPRGAVDLHVELGEDRFYTRQGNGEPRALLRVNADHWRREDETVASIALLRQTNGCWLLQGERDNYLHNACGAEHMRDRGR